MEFKEFTKNKIYTYRVTSGKFKGKILKSYDSRHYFAGLNGPYVCCFDENNNEYVIFFSELEDVKES